MTAALGPTEIKTARGGRLRAIGPAGTFCLIRSNIEHRGTRNRTGQRRLMIKLVVGVQP